MGSSAFDSLPRCSGTKVDGTPCRSKATGEGTYCLAHDPARAEKFKQVQKAGGHGNRLRHVANPSASDVDKIKAETLFELQEGLITEEQANSRLWRLNQLGRGEEGERRKRQRAKEEERAAAQEIQPHHVVATCWMLSVPSTFCERSLHRLARMDAVGGGSTRQALMKYLTGEPLKDGRMLGRDIDPLAWLADLMGIELERLSASMAGCDQTWLKRPAPVETIPFQGFAQEDRAVAGDVDVQPVRRPDGSLVVWQASERDHVAGRKV